MRLAALALVLCAACAGEALAPIARVDLTPESLCERQDDQSVIISAKRSVTAEGSPDGLTYAWSFSRQPSRLLRGGVDTMELAADFASDVPIAVRLRVEDTDGLVDTRERILGLTRATRTPCSAGCAAHEECITIQGDAVCSAPMACSSDADCGCLKCLLDDAGQARCLEPQ